MNRNYLIAAGAAIAVIAAILYCKKAFSEQPEPGEQGADTSDNMVTNQPLSTKNFKLSEFDCHDGTKVPTEFYGNVSRLMKNLQVLRDNLGVPIHVNSGYRSPAYNAKISGSAKNSTHMKAMASDITALPFTPKQVHARIESLIAAGKMDQGGLGLYPGFVHYDVRGFRARW